ncbi:MAG TPA: homogentisate 1,2-dioxygenase, partial [Acidimicrobiales bacterium]|nr:homogentisate 1,2-dioxygenase [Acidimicrobiales bacterium]
MSYYVRVGDVPRKRHTWFRSEGGGRLHEELMGEEGFSGASSLLYHLRSPSAITAVEAFSVARAALSPNDPLAPWHIRASKLAPGGDPVLGRHVLLGNEDVTVCWVEASASSGLYRNAAGDELVYV